MQTTYTKEQIDRLVTGIYDICLREEEQEVFESCNRQQFEDLLAIIRAAAGTIGVTLRPDPVTSCHRDYQDGDAGKWRYGVTGTVAGCNLAIWRPHTGLEELQVKHYEDNKYQVIYCDYNDNPTRTVVTDRKQTTLALAYFMQTEQLTPSLEWKTLWKGEKNGT